MHFRFLSAKWNATTRYSARPFTTKTGARVHSFCLNSPRSRGWYQARVHAFSSGNGKGDPSGNLTWLLLKMGILDSYVSLPKDICRLWGVKELENSVSYNGFMEL